MKKIFKILVFSILLSKVFTINLKSSGLQAQLILEENFNYTAGDSLGQISPYANGWIPNTGGALNPIYVTSPGLIFAGYPSSGIGNAITLKSSGQDKLKDFSQDSVNTGTVYASFMIRVDSAARGDYFMAFLESGSTTNYKGRVYARSINGTGNISFGITKSNSSSDTLVGGIWTPHSYYKGVTYLLVLKYLFVPGSTSNDEVSLFVFNLDLPATEPLIPEIGPITYFSADASAIGRIGIRQGTNTRAPNAVVDGIRVSTSWSSLLTSQNFCKTPSNEPDYLQTIPGDQLQLPPTGSCCINICIHTMRMDDGSGGLTYAQVSQALNRLTQDFAQHNICFKIISMDDIPNTALYYKSTFLPDESPRDGKFDDFSPLSCDSDGIDIYFFGMGTLNFGMASQIGATALVIGGDLAVLPHILSHEMGHCLGLYHTFHGMPCEPGTCEEHVNGSTKYTCGDYVYDTQADPTLFDVSGASCTRYPWLPATCKLSNIDPDGNTYEPNHSLIMAYVPPNCMQSLTSGQGYRMGSMITNFSLLKATLETDCFGTDSNGGSGQGVNSGDFGCKYFFANSKAPYPLYPSRPVYSWENDPVCRIKLIENGVNQAGSKLVKAPDDVTGMDDGYFRLSLNEIQSLCNSDPTKKLKLCGVCYDSLFIGTNGIIGFSEYPTGLSPHGNLHWYDFPANFGTDNFINGNYDRPAIYPLWIDFTFRNPDSTGGINGLTCGIKNNQLIITYLRAMVFNKSEYVSFQVCFELVDCMSDNANIKFTYSNTNDGRTSPAFITRYKNSNNSGGSPLLPNLGPYLVGIAPQYITPSNILYRKTDGFGYMWDPGPLSQPRISRPLYNADNSGLSVEFGPNPFQLGKCRCDIDNYCPPECITDSLNISTGVDHKNNALYPDYKNDEYWKLVTSPLNTRIPLLPKLAGVLPAALQPPQWYTQSSSKWISAYSEWFSVGHYPSPDLYVFETCFYICANESVVNINLEVMTDDGGSVILDGLEIGGPTGFGGPTPVNVTRTLSRGEHFIRVLVTNGGGGPMGINVNGSIKGSNILKHECWSCTRFSYGGRAVAEYSVLQNAMINLIDTKPPYSVAASGSAYSDSAGNLFYQFPYPVSEGEYYIAIKSQNTIETWSANPVSITADSIVYDFTSGQSQAYGNNMIEINGKWCFYSGDVTQDGIIDGSDMSEIENDALTGVEGNFATDLNNDEIVDAFDLSIVENNSVSGIYVITP